jgi:hypothetical protein
VKMRNEETPSASISEQPLKSHCDQAEDAWKKERMNSLDGGRRLSNLRCDSAA